MTPTMRIRLWARQAPRSQVATTAVVAVAVIAALASILVPESDAAVAGFAVTNLDPVTGAPVAAATEATSGAPMVTSTGANAASPPPGETPAPRLVGAPVTAATGPAFTPEVAAEPRRASAQGITEDTIKIGFLINKTGGLDATGFAIGIRQDQPETIKAIVDWANANGGIKGRTVEYVTVEEDGTNSATWQPACVTMTEDEKVFAVMSGASHNGSGVLCYAERHVPDLNTGSVTVSEETFQRSGGYLVSSGASGSRAVLNWADVMLAEGTIGPGVGKVGLLTAECPQDVEVMDKSLKPFLERAGVDFVEGRVSCDLGAAQQQVPAAVLQMRNAGVDRVFVGVLFPTAQTFMQQASAQQWRPTYLVSDFWGNNLDFTSANYPPDQFDRTVATAFSHTGEDEANHSDPVKLCDKILRDAGLDGITEQMGKDSEVVSECDNFFLFMKVMEQLPLNPTHDQWPDAVARVGAVAGAYAVDARFGPGKYNGGDSYALVEWRRECTCWKQIRPHRPGRV